MARGYGGNGEAVQFSFGPLTQVALQQAAQKRAENMLLDRQIATEQAKLAPAGIRTQDMNGFLSRYQKIKDLSINYRDAIRNPTKNPQKYTEYQNALGDLQAYIAESKGAKEMNKAAYGFYSKNAQKIDQDAFRSAAADFNAPIGTPEFERGKNYDITQAIWNPAQFEGGKYETWLNAAAPRKEYKDPHKLSSGQTESINSMRRDPIQLANAVGNSYDADMFHVKKLYDDAFAKADPSDIAAKEQYVKKYLPDFQIKTPRDLAIADRMYGQVEQDMGSSISGAPTYENQKFAREQQARAQAFAKEQQARGFANKGENDKNYSVLPDMAKMLKAGRYKEALAPLEAATPGTQSIVLKNGRTPAASLALLKKDIKANGIDSQTRNLTDDDFKNGVLVTTVPRMNPASPKETLKRKGANGKMEIVYDYMATPVNKPNIQPRLQQHMNFSSNQKKPVKNSVFKNMYAPPPPTAAGALDFSTDDEANETVPDTETTEEEQ